MRLISQDETTDIPYEKFVFAVTKDNAIACASCPVASPSNISLVATYSTREKALKVMEMLREQYERYEVMKILACGSVEYMTRVLMGDEFIKINQTYRDVNVFKFPKDDEVEV